MTSLCFGRYGREDNTLIMTTRGEGVRPGKGFRAGGDGDRPDPGKEEVGVESKAHRRTCCLGVASTGGHISGSTPFVNQGPGLGLDCVSSSPQYPPAPAIMSGTSQCSINNCEMDASTSGRRLHTISSQKLSLSRETDTYRNEST